MSELDVSTNGSAAFFVDVRTSGAGKSSEVCGRIASLLPVCASVTRLCHLPLLCCGMADRLWPWRKDSLDRFRLELLSMQVDEGADGLHLVRRAGASANRQVKAEGHCFEEEEVASPRGRCKANLSEPA